MSYQLPEPAYTWTKPPNNIQRIIAGKQPLPNAIFTADQVLAAYLAGVEEAAKVADVQVAALRPDSRPEHIASHTTAWNIAEGIRALAADGLVERKG